MHHVNRTHLDRRSPVCRFPLWRGADEVRTSRLRFALRVLGTKFKIVNQTITHTYYEASL